MKAGHPIGTERLKDQTSRLKLTYLMYQCGAFSYSYKLVYIIITISLSYLVIVVINQLNAILGAPHCSNMVLLDSTGMHKYRHRENEGFNCQWCCNDD